MVRLQFKSGWASVLSNTYNRANVTSYTTGRTIFFDGNNTEQYTLKTFEWVNHHRNIDFQVHILFFVLFMEK